MNNLSVTTIGGVVRPGEEILQIIPLDEELFVEARVKPENIAGVRPGQEATVKLSAYDYTIYGTLKGTVKLISADTFKDERSRSPDGDPHYKVTLQVDTEHLTPRQASLQIRPGMQASVELHTGSKVSVRSDCPACLTEWVIVSTIDSGHLEVGDGGEEGFEEAGLV